MHLIWENTLKNLIQLWTGQFNERAVSHTGQPYRIDSKTWNKIGSDTLAAGRTIPLVFSTVVPNIAKKGVMLTAEMYSNWTLYIAPVLLQDAFEEVAYYSHFLLLVRLIRLCLAIDMSPEDLDEVEVGFRKWVQEYETLYYMHDPQRLSCCPLTIHALLHIANGIRACGPVWVYWAYPMERHCNDLLQAIRSRRHPYTSILNFVTATAQLDQIRLMYNAEDELNLDPDKLENGLIIDYEDCMFLTPPLGPDVLTSAQIHKIQVHLSTRWCLQLAEIKARFPLAGKVLQFGRVVMLDLGDIIRTQELFKAQEDTRDNTFVRYNCDIDENANYPRRPEVMVEESFFGWLLSVFVVDIPDAPEPPHTLALALIKQIDVCHNADLDTFTFKDANVGVRADEVIDLSRIQCVLGRVYHSPSKTWYIVDRTSSVGSCLA
ncbi:hypothetical protein BJ165DRAFT_1347492 [Panaeolus papilionaceus]|nr:hypothetical protein BJ165DRAFT_1347492 [Panaeolus papilionaceus]